MPIKKKKQDRALDWFMSAHPDDFEEGDFDEADEQASRQRWETEKSPPAIAPLDRDLILTHLPDAPVSAEARVPEGWEMEPGTIKMYPGVVIPASIVITTRYFDAEDRTVTWEIHWKTEEAWDSMIVSRGVALNTRKLPELAARGFPVTSQRARRISEYLDAYERANHAAIPAYFVTRRCGWIGTDLFSAGSRVITPDVGGNVEESTPCRFSANGPEEEGLIQALRAGGTLIGWKDAFELIRPQPKAKFAVYASLTAPLLKLLGVQNFVVDFCGETSVGKTAAQYGGASVWGYPPGDTGGLTLSWNTTQVYAERYAALMCDLPIFMEDSQTADSRHLSAIVYTLANGVGKGRGTIPGVKGVLRWNTVVLSSGERPLQEVAQYGGITARVVTLWGSPFGSNDQGTLVRRFKSEVAEHFGHVGPMFIQFLVDNRGRWDEFRAQYRQYVQQLAEMFPNNVGDRFASYFAAIMLGGELAGPILGLEPGEAMEDVLAVMEELVDPQEDADLATKALDDFVSWIVANQPQFLGKTDPKRSPYTILGLWKTNEFVAVFPHTARSQLRRLGYSPEPTLRSWRERGRLLVSEPNRFTYKVRIDGGSTNMIALTWDTIGLDELNSDENSTWTMDASPFGQD